MATDPTKLHDLSSNSIPGVEGQIAPDPESGSALDAAFAAKGGDPTKPEAELKVEPKKTDEGTPAPKDEPAPKKKEKGETIVPQNEISPGDALDALANPKTDDDDAPAPTPKKKADETPAPKKDEQAPPAPEKDELDGVELPINVKPNTVKSFDRVKEVARERISAVLKEKEALAKEVAELKTKVTAGLPKEVETELKTLRDFRAKLDVEADPAFSTYDKTVVDNTEAIYAKLLATPGIDQKQVDAIKALGGPGEVDWDGPGIKLPAPIRRFIDAKLLENETVTEKKAKAIADAKANAEQYVASRREEQTKSAELANKAVETEIETLLPKFPWFKELKAKEGATDEEKKAVESHNALIADARGVFKDAVTDNSPAMRSILAVGYAQLLKTRVDFTDYRTKAEAKEKAFAEEKAALTKELEEVKTKLEKVKRSSTTRLRDTSAEDTAPAAKSKNVDLTTAPGDALDKHLAAIRAAQESNS